MNKKSLLLKNIFFLSLFLFPLTVLPEDVLPPARTLDGITLIPTRNRNDLALGLQYVTKMPENVGILFRDLGQVNSFHSRNCLFTIEMTALDKDGKILQMVDTLPENDRVKIPEGTRYVIETNANVMRRKGFKVGNRIEFNSLQKSVNPSLNLEDHLPRTGGWREKF